jgi:hypothetical protein
LSQYSVRTGLSGIHETDLVSETDGLITFVEQCEKTLDFQGWDNAHSFSSAESSHADCQLSTPTHLLAQWGLPNNISGSGA